MSATTVIKADRINLRLKNDTKRTLERAASFEGKTVSKFILSSALERAERTIQDHEVMKLNRDESEAFFTALAAPVRFNSKLAAAFEEHDKRVISR